MPYPASHAARVRQPGRFDQDSFRTKEITDGVSYILGKLKSGNGAMILQAVRFDKTKFTPVQAQKWLKDNNVTPLTFEKATDEKTQENSMTNTPVSEAEITKREDGKDFPASDFAYTPDKTAPSTWKLRLTNTPGGEPDTGIVGAAIAALGKGFRGQKVEIPSTDIASVKRKVLAAWKKANPDKDIKDAPPTIAENGCEFVSPDVFSFAQLEQSKLASEIVESAQETITEFVTLAQNILFAPTEIIPDKAGALRGLIDELVAVLPEMATAAAIEGSAEVAEAVTIKSRVRAAIKALDELLEDKEVPALMRDRVKDLREAFKKNWADLASDAASGFERAQESEPLCESYAGIDSIAEADGEAQPGNVLYMNIQPIRPGAGNSKDNHWYSREMLSANASKLVGARMYETDHRPNEKSTRTWVSTITELTGFTDDGAPIMRVAVHDPNFAQRVRNLAEGKDEAGKSLLTKLECSLLANGVAKPGNVNGKQYKVIESITDVESVDWVTRAGAGGHALEIAECDGGIMDEQKTEQATEQPTQPEPVAEAQVVRLSEAAVGALLKSETRLPAASRVRLAEAQYETEDAVKAAMTKELEYLSEAVGAGKPFGLGATVPAQSLSPDARERKVAEALDRVNKKYLG